jgi:acetyl-CoA carboxylase carboxyltransferase component
VLDLVGAVLAYLPDHTDAEPPRRGLTIRPSVPVPELREMIPASSTASYDVRDIIGAVADDGEILEVRPMWAPQLVTALTSVGGMPIGVVANQPRAMAGTLDIPASQKGARFVRFCDAFNIPILTMVDTPGFLPGQGSRVAGHDPSWGRARFRLRRGHRAPGVPGPAQGLRRGLHRHGLQGHRQRHLPGLALGPDRRHGRAGGRPDPPPGWPTRSCAVWKAIYAEEYLTPWVAAERGFVDAVIDPADTRADVHRALTLLASRSEHLQGRKHDNGPL